MFCPSIAREKIYAYALQGTAVLAQKALFLQLGNRQVRVVGFMLRPFYLRGKNPRYPYQRVGESQSRSERFSEEKKNLFSCQESNQDALAVQHEVQSPFLLSQPGSCTAVKCTNFKNQRYVRTTLFKLRTPVLNPQATNVIYIWSTHS